MAFQSLYRRYRSQRFDEVLGQDHVTTALRNAVRENRVGQGYLFTGPRGTGKTSTARILAKVLNCENPVDGEPDTTCANCLAVERGQLVDWLQELDAASNNGVADMRALLERVSMGTSGSRKVYILDEVHMLSAGAANALLKTLEEPPDHVVFVLATTEPQKLLATISSRTQKFDFNLLAADVLADHVRFVIDDAGLDLGEDAVDYVVRAGRGSARDTLSALDQVAAAGGVLVDDTSVDELLDAIAASDAAAALVAIDASVRSGRDPRVLATSLVESLRSAFLTSMGAPSTGLSDQATSRATDLAASVGPGGLTRALEGVGAALVEMRQAPDPRIPLEVAVVRLTRPASGDAPDALVGRIERLEAAVAVIDGAGASTRPDTGGDAIAKAPQDPTAGPAVGVPRDPVEPSARPVTPRRSGAAAARARLAERAGVDDADTDAGTGRSQPVDDSDGAPPGRRDEVRGRPTLGAVRAARSGSSSSGGDRSGLEPAGSAVDGGSAGKSHDGDGADGSAPAEAAGDDPAPAGIPSTGELQAAWDSTILSSMSLGMRARFKTGRFVETSGATARFALPNEAHRNNCEPRCAEVAEALSSHFGRRIPLELVVDDQQGDGDSTGADGGEQDADDAVDFDEVAALDDAPDALAEGLARLHDAFPGATLEEENR